MSSPDNAAFDPNAEREIDLRSTWSKIADRWWLPVVGALLGAILGVLVSVGGGDMYEAKTLLYLGQPFTPSGGGQIQSLQTNPKTVSEIIRSESAIKRAAVASGLTPAQLRGNVTSQAVTSVGQTRNTSPLINIEVQAPARVKAANAADSLARSVMTNVSGYVASKSLVLKAQIAAYENELESLAERIDSATQQQATILANTELPLTDRLLVSANLNATISTAEQRRGTVRTELANTRQLLSLAEDVEMPFIVEPASSVRTVATSRRNAAVVGAIVGLLGGALVALVWDPVSRRRRRPEPAS